MRSGKIDPSAYNSMREDAKEAERIKSDLSHLRQEIEQAEHEEEETRRQDHNLRLMSQNTANTASILKSEPPCNLVKDYEV